MAVGRILALTDSHGLNLSIVKDFKQSTYASDANDRTGELFGLCRPYRTQANVVHTVFDGFLHMLNRVAGHADDGVWG